ncbi:MAG: PKD domain-containing protein [Bacteroidetes bacterium]|nr:PKD domain-containing protein [Bacteroidota bacterium]
MQTIIIPDAPKAEFSIDTSICSSEITTIVNNSTAANAYFWYLKDSMISNLKNPLAFSISAVGSYDIKLIVTGSNCIDSLTKTVVVNPNPKVHLSFSEICNGARFIDSTINSVFRIWDFGDGDTSVLTEVDHMYSSPGIYQVKLKVFNIQGCADSTIESVIIHKAPKADFKIDSIVCASETISIINNSTDASNYFWELGDSRTSNLMTPEAFSYNTTGSYQIKLVASTSVCSDSLIQTVFVMPNPVVKIGSSTLTDSTIQFYDSSSISAGSIVSWDWNFGDGKTSTIRHPVHIYSSPDTYTVELCVTSNEGCENCDIKSIVVTATGIAMSEIDNLISIYPNPNKGVFIIKSSTKLDLIVITNAFGQEIMVIKPKTDTELIDLSNKPKGVYIVKLRLENHDQISRIIKN